MNAEMKAKTDYLVKDLGLADWGRKEIKIAETEMPGLMAIRQEFCEGSAAARRAHRRLAAHDHPDRGADRDAERPGRRSALGLVQHLLDPGPCRGGDRRGRDRGIRGEGRDARGVLGLHAPHLRVAGRRPRQHDPRRRRRRDAPAASGRARREGRLAGRLALERGGAVPLRRHQGEAQDRSEVVFDPPRQDQGRDRGDDDRRQAALSDGARRGASHSPRST